MHQLPCILNPRFTAVRPSYGGEALVGKPKQDFVAGYSQWRPNLSSWESQSPGILEQDQQVLRGDRQSLLDGRAPDNNFQIEPYAPPMPSKIAGGPTLGAVSIEDRKHFFIYTPTESMRERMKTHVLDVERILDPHRSDNECHFHPRPPECNGNPAGSIRCNYNWTDLRGSHRVCVNWGIVALLLKGTLEDTVVEGFIRKAWQLSHLCGNWTCCNWRHFTIESGSTNVSRNRCFASPCKCPHVPPCMKEKKAPLPLTPAICMKIVTAIIEAFDVCALRWWDSRLDYTTQCLLLNIYSGTHPARCFLCDDHRNHISVHSCPVLKSLEQCRHLLCALRLCEQPTEAVAQAVVYLEILIGHLAGGSGSSQSSHRRRPLLHSVKHGKVVKQETRKVAKAPSYTANELDKLWASAGAVKKLAEDTWLQWV